MIDEDAKLVEEGPEAVLTPGAMLQRAREAKGLDVRAAADQLRMSRVKLMALEADAFEEFQGETFIRGYIKAYCRILDMDEVQAISRYEAFVVANAKVAKLIEPSETLGLGFDLYNKRSPKLIVGALILLTLLLLAYLAKTFLHVEPSEVVPTAVTSTADTGLALQSSENHEAANALAQQPLSQSKIEPASDSQPELEQLTAHQPEAIATPTSAAVFDTLTIVFLDECWLEVSDSKGDVLATELKEAGSEVILQGRAPFNVMLGNARAATVFINGNKVDSNPRNTNRALRFTVNQP